MARAARTIVVAITVDERGDVLEARVVSWHTLLQATVLSAALRAKFTPTTLSGKPVKVACKITCHFTLDE